MNKTYTGVSWKKDRNLYESKVTHDGRTYRCGYFPTEKEAAIARDKTIITHGLNVKLQVLKAVKK